MQLLTAVLLSGHHVVLLQWPLNQTDAGLFAHMHIWDVRNQQLIYDRPCRATDTPCWSPDGSIFAFSESDDDGSSWVSFMDMLSLATRRMNGDMEPMQVTDASRQAFKSTF